MLQQNTTQRQGLRVWGSIAQTVGTSPGMTFTLFLSGMLFNCKNWFLPQATYQGCGFLNALPGTLTDINFPSFASFNNCCFEGIACTLIQGGATLFQCGAFNSPIMGFNFPTSPSPSVISDFCLGQGNAGIGVFVGNGTIIQKIGGVANMKTTGASGDWNFGGGSALAWSDAPRAQNQGSGHGTLTAGSLPVTVSRLPADAEVQANYRGAPASGFGIVYPTSQTTSGFMVASTATGDTSSVSWYWFSPASAAGGVFTT